jgi:hypothetical protein
MTRERTHPSPGQAQAAFNRLLHAAQIRRRNLPGDMSDFISEEESDLLIVRDYALDLNDFKDKVEGV